MTRAFIDLHCHSKGSFDCLSDPRDIVKAASGSSIRNASLAPALSAASRTARFSTDVTPAGTEIITSGREIAIRPFVALAMKKRSMASVMT